MDEKRGIIKKRGSLNYFQFLQFKRILKSIILVFLLQFASIGCIPNSKYLVSKEPVIINKEELGSWTELEGRIMDINSENIIINLKEREYKNTEEKFKYNLKYKYAFRKRKERNDPYSSIPLTSSERTKLLISELSIIAGTALGVGLSLSGAFDVEEEENSQYIIGDEKFGRALMASLITCLGIGFFYITINKTTRDITPIGIRKKVISDHEQILANKPVNVLIQNSGLKKEYFTNAEGNLLIKKKEILPYSRYKGSTVALNISYQDRIIQIWVPGKFINK